MAGLCRARLRKKRPKWAAKAFSPRWRDGCGTSASGLAADSEPAMKERPIYLIWFPLVGRRLLQLGQRGASPTVLEG